jgi:hypothetical protein
MHQVHEAYEHLPPPVEEMHPSFALCSPPLPAYDHADLEQQSLKRQDLLNSPASCTQPSSCVEPKKTPQPSGESGLKEDPSRHKGRFEVPGWRTGARIAAATTLLTLLVNLGVAIWAATVTLSSANVLGQVYQGDCGQVEEINTWVHFAINALSTALLSASNYCMQCLSAPTREEVDEAHANGKWLDIGIYSLRNLSNIAPKKRWLWWLLALSSLPLHLMYNSAFFSSLASHDYNVVYATEDWVNGAAYKLDDGVDLGLLVPSSFDVAKVQRSVSEFQTLNNTECIKAYATDFTPSRQTVVVVCDETSSKDPNPLLGIAHNRFAAGGSPVYSYAWYFSARLIPLRIVLTNDRICDTVPADWGIGVTVCPRNYPEVLAHASEWKPNGHKEQNTVSVSWSQNLSVCADTMSMLQLSGSS